MVRLVQLHDADDVLAPEHGSVDFQGDSPVLLVDVLGLFKLRVLPSHTPFHGVQEAVIVGELLPDKLGLVAPENRAVTAPDFHSEDVAQRAQLTEKARQVWGDRAGRLRGEQGVCLNVVLERELRDLLVQSYVRTDLVVDDPPRQGDSQGDRNHRHNDERRDRVLQDDISANTHSTFLSPARPVGPNRSLTISRGYHDRYPCLLQRLGWRRLVEQVDRRRLIGPHFSRAAVFNAAASSRSSRRCKNASVTVSCGAPSSLQSRQRTKYRPSPLMRVITLRWAQRMPPPLAAPTASPSSFSCFSIISYILRLGGPAVSFSYPLG